MPKKFRGNGNFRYLWPDRNPRCRVEKQSFFVCSGTLLSVSLSGPNTSVPAPKTFADMEFLAQYNLTGIVIGLATFLIIGLFHPLVIRGEYYFGVRIWWVFLVMGLAAVAGSIAVRHVLWSTLLAVWGASSLWSIGELFEQRKRVARGWFPKNPARKYPDAAESPEQKSRRS